MQLTKSASTEAVSMCRLECICAESCVVNNYMYTVYVHIVSANCQVVCDLSDVCRYFVLPSCQPVNSALLLCQCPAHVVPRGHRAQ